MAEVTSCYLEFHVSGETRRALVKAVSDFTQEEVSYLGVPSFAYHTGQYTIGRHGKVTCDDYANRDAILKLLNALLVQGIQPDALCFEIKDIPAANEDSELPFDLSMGNLSIGMPRYFVSLERLLKLLEQNGHLIRGAIGMSAITVRVERDAVFFPWFTQGGGEAAITAYARFISALCKVSREQEIGAVMQPMENEKHAFHRLLMLLGFSGPEYRQERKILFRYITDEDCCQSGVYTIRKRGDKNDK